MTQALLDSFGAKLSIDVQAFLPELIVCAAIVLLLFARLFPRFDRAHLGRFAGFMTLLALAVSWWQWHGWLDVAGERILFDPRISLAQPHPQAIDLFTGLLVFDNFAIFLKLFLYGFTLLTIVMALLTGIPDKEDSADFFVLMLGAALGMSLMASANHLLVVFLGIEMASVPSYALAGFLKGRRTSSEAALKYVVYGGGAAGVMLYGISLLAGKYGTGYLPDVLQFVAAGRLDAVVVMGLLFVFVGVAFKLAAVPFHFWCPDVFEGAPAEVAGYLSVASKGAALALLARLAYGLAGLTIAIPASDAWANTVPYLVPALAVFAIVTTTFGNLAAYAQTNLKRLLAYSTIAHAGFMMMGLATLTREGIGAVLFYLVTYLFMNLGAFTVVAFLRNQTGSEDLRDLRGIVHRAPVLVVTLGVFLLSLLGLPPLAGFIAKFQIFAALFDAARLYHSRGETALGTTMILLVAAGGLNTVLSLFYYVKVLKVMVLERSLAEVEGTPEPPLPLPWIHAGYVSVLALVLLALGLWWNPLTQAAAVDGVAGFRPVPAATPVLAERGER